LSPAQRLTFAVLAVLAVFLVGTAGYMLLEEHPQPTFAEAAFMTVITVSTVGFEEVWPLTPVTRIWTIGVITVGIVTVSYAFTSLVALIVRGELHREREKRRRMKSIQQLDGHVILCGYGRAGTMVTSELKRQGLGLVVVDNDRELESTLKDERIPYVIGDATSEELLLQAGIVRASALVATLPSDADNVFITLTANALRPDIEIIARAERPATEGKLRRAGAKHVICPAIIGARKMAALILRPGVVDFAETVAGGVELETDEYAVPAGSALDGRTLRESNVRNISGANIVAIRRVDGQTVYNPAPDTVISHGDTLVLVGPWGISDKLQLLEETKPA